MKNKSTQFQPGKSGNPTGRPVGSRNKLSELFITDLQQIWTEQGISVLQRVADEHPEKLMAAMVQILPKDFQVTIDQKDTKWVISAKPKCFEQSTEDWLVEHKP